MCPRRLSIRTSSTLLPPQNIDGLDLAAGLTPDEVVEAHGSFARAHCVECGHDSSVVEMREAVRASRNLPLDPPPPLGDDPGAPGLRCAPEASGPCALRGENPPGLVKPGIVFFGENLPDRFHELAPEDLGGADLLIVLGTSLAVQPFAGLIGVPGLTCPRVLINREPAAQMSAEAWGRGARRNGFFWGEGNFRDVLLRGDCDAGVEALCEAAGWLDELRELKAASDTRLQAAAQAAADEAWG